jgi:Selenocysteine lyase
MCGPSLPRRGGHTRRARRAASPTGRKFETGTLPYELLAGFSATVAYLETIGGIEEVRTYERELGAHFLAQLPANVELYGLPTMEGRVPTFLFNVRACRRRGRRPARGAGLRRLGGGQLVLRRPRPPPAGAVAARGDRALQHRDEVDRLLAALGSL